MVVDGNVISGAQNIFFAELASKSTEHFSVSATRFMTGKFPVMIFGLPAAAFAIYKTAYPEKKKQVGGLLLSAALTSMLTGITEPLEFTFLFAAPAMYAVHCVLAGLSYMIMHILNVTVGMTFSGGAIDFILFGILQGNRKTNWIWILIVGLFFAIVYFFVFFFMIEKCSYKTPGREENGQDVKLYTRKDLEAKKKGTKSESGEDNSDRISALILEGLGGEANISDVDCCATRLRVTVVDANLVSDTILKQSGASGVICKGNGVQVIYGPQVSVVKSNLEEFMEKEAEQKQIVLTAYMNGTVIPLERVEDEVFSQKILGEGAAIEPEEGKLYSPCNGKVAMIFDTKHAIGLVTEDGVELLIHVGIDTVQLNGKCFDVKVKAGDKVKTGDLLSVVDLEGIKAAGYRTVTPVIVSNTEDYAEVKMTAAEGSIKAGAELLKIK